MAKVNLENIRALTDFKRNTNAFRERLKKSGLPTVLTVDGRAELVVQDAEAYQRLLDIAERVETLESIRAGFESALNGKGRDAKSFFAGLRRDLKPSARKSA